MTEFALAALIVVTSLLGYALFFGGVAWALVLWMRDRRKG